MAHASFTIDAPPIFRSPVDAATGNQRIGVTFTAYFTSGRHKTYTEDFSVQIENPPGTPKTLAQQKLAVFAVVRTRVNALDTLDAAPLPVDLSGNTGGIGTRYDASIASPTPIAAGDIPADDSTPSRA